MENALNLCDMFPSYTARGYKDEEYDRIYHGSYFCSNYFLKTMGEQIHDEKATIVIPTVTERYYTRVMDCLASYLGHCGSNPEIVVNDLGTMSYISHEYSLKMTAGRLLFKDLRDVRHNDISEYVSPKILCDGHLEMLRQFGISAVELDRGWRQIDLSDVPGDIAIHMHRPMMYVSCGNICEFASINRDEEHKFRPNDSCNYECSQLHNEYAIDSNSYFRIGKGVFTFAFRSEIIGREPNREITTPYDLRGLRI